MPLPSSPVPGRPIAGPAPGSQRLKSSLCLADTRIVSGCPPEAPPPHSGRAALRAAWSTGHGTMRTKSSARSLLALTSLVVLSACEAQKSETPLSPSVAGPIPGVNITAPRPVEPSAGTKLKDSQQPIRLTIENSTTSGVRPISYTFEVASDSAFTTKVFGRGSVPPGDAKTSVVLDRLEIGRTYYWRARAEDGANTGPYVSAQFDLLPKPFIAAPVPTSPINNAVADSRQPTLHTRNTDKNAAVGG